MEDGSILVAGWTWTAHPFGEYGTTATSAPATEQQQGVNAIFTYSNILNSTSTTFKDASIATNNWQSGSEYWQIALDTTGYTELALTFSAYGSNTGPKEFQVQISNDGENFFNVTDGDYVLKSSVPTSPLKTSLPLVSPGDISNIDNTATAYIRFQNTSTVSVNDKVTASTGTSRLYNIRINGIPNSTSPSTVARPTAKPTSGMELIKGDNVELSCATQGATIHYTTDGTEPTESSAKYTDAIVLNVVGETTV